MGNHINMSVSEAPLHIDARERMLVAADKLFMELGYKTVTLRDIADAVGIKHASLYYHVPGGKEQLFIEVVERTLRAHQIGLTQAMAAAGPNVRDGLAAAAGWLLGHAPMDLMRMQRSDLREIDPAQATRLGRLMLESLLKPVSTMLEQACARGEIAAVDCNVIAGALVTMLEGLHGVPDIAFAFGPGAWTGKTRLDMAHYLIEALLKGLFPRNDP